MSITLSEVEYTYIGSISAGLADVLDLIASDSTPSRAHISKDNLVAITRLKAHMEAEPDDAEEVKMLLEKIEANGEIDIAWG
jgi:molybdopterin-biosynthesis enzyme MoeA-like protein